SCCASSRSYWERRAARLAADISSFAVARPKLNPRSFSTDADETSGPSPSRFAEDTCRTAGQIPSSADLPKPKTMSTSPGRQLTSVSTLPRAAGYFQPQPQPTACGLQLSAEIIACCVIAHPIPHP